MTHRVATSFWRLFERLPQQVQRAARKQHQRLLDDPTHPSLNLKPVGRYWSVRVTGDCRALGIWDEQADAMIWFFIGTHADYDKLLAR